ncbi:hypothetical protein GF339_00825 [candidate division KSB3 bacterium]|uniref:Archease domain-containing protein n=1 Tax=candidate division KSB3 bacterium TaxID=2044937 RepID=A0A9D5JSA8_9BACT|nr:hypothetical protein [candidate division KSB3 bacterium]MBD3323092.1 hypothetical protein [candidate division KSB3 bacterium]
MQRYREFEHTADIGVEVYGHTLTELFQNAGYALFDTIADVTTIRPTVTRSLTITGADPETFLMNWLRELLYLSALHQEVYAEFDIHTLTTDSDVQEQPASSEEDAYRLTASVHGEPLDLDRHRFKAEIKAITYHQFCVQQEADQWRARMIFDV